MARRMFRQSVISNKNLPIKVQAPKKNPKYPEEGAGSLQKKLGAKAALVAHQDDFRLKTRRIHMENPAAPVGEYPPLGRTQDLKAK